MHKKTVILCTRLSTTENRIKYAKILSPMNEEKKTRWLGSFTCSILILVTAFIILFIFSFGLQELTTESRAELIAYICYDLVIGLGTFNILRKFPFAYWYAPVITNLTGIIAAIIEPNFWITNIWVYVGSGWVLTLIAVFIGYRVGKKTQQKADQQDPN